MRSQPTSSPSTNLPVELRGTVLITGAGVSGLGCAILLHRLGVDVVVADDNPQARDNVLQATNGQARVLEVAQAQAGLGEYHLVVTSPGWRPDSPVLLAAARAGLDVIGDVELAYRLDRAGVFGPPRTWLVVTGTNGKTTTTAMLADMMAQAGPRSQAVGNIGVAVTDALVAEERIEVLVAELSSFQLHWSSQLTPDAGVLLNLAQDHIDWHGGFAEYAAAKARVLTGPVAVAGIDDTAVVEQLNQIEPADPIGFTLGVPAEGQFGVVDGQLVDNTTGQQLPLAPAEGIEPHGPAGVLDALAAAAVARSQGVTPEQIATALRQFRVDGHRGQVVHHADGVDFIDNSKATNPHAADSALAGLASVIWVAGGQLKGADVHELIRTHAAKLKAVLLLGVDRRIFADTLAEVAPQVPVHLSDSTDPADAMTELIERAAAMLAPGDSVVLAPAAASLDMYTGMAQRGDLFTAAVHAKMGPPQNFLPAGADSAGLDQEET